MKKYVSEFQLFDNLPLDELRFTIHYDVDDFEYEKRKTDILNLLDLAFKFDLKSFGRNADTVHNHLSKQPDTAHGP